MLAWLEKDDPFPDVRDAWGPETDFPGLLAASADITPERLLDAYSKGIFPWYSEPPVLWWFLSPRMVLKTDEFKISRSLRKSINRVHRSCHEGSRYTLSFDTDFEAVMRECAAPRKDQDGTWITEEIVSAYCALHEAGYAHSCELRKNNMLVGGLYGVSLGTMFFGESMFARETDASKIALAYLVSFLSRHGVTDIDCQMETSHLASLGARPVSANAFTGHLKKTVTQPQIVFPKGVCAFCGDPFPA